MPSDRYDSDPDFNPGSYAYEPPKKRRRISTKFASHESVEPLPKRERGRAETLKRIPERLKSTTNKDGKSAKMVQTSSSNPLLEYFKDARLHDSSDDEADDAEEEVVESEEDADRSDYSNEVDGEIHYDIMRTFNAAMQSITRASTISTMNYEKEERQEDSDTEPESEQEQESAVNSNAPPASSLVRHHSLLRTHQERISRTLDESETESESETEQTLPDATRLKHNTVSGRNSQPYSAFASLLITGTDPTTDPQHDCTHTDSGSDTETDTEEEDEKIQDFRPRPTFPLKAGQRILPPLALDDKYSVPSRINTFLREYQRDGIRFFFERYKNGQGGLLGDDMGLGLLICILFLGSGTYALTGKTIQVISFLSSIMQKSGDTRDIDRRRKHVSRLQDVSEEWRRRRVLPPANETWPTCLIIAPSSVVGNWEREFETWGYFEVGTYTGKERTDVLVDFKLGRLDVVLTSFETARKDISLLDDLAWSCIIVDEAHRLKNPRSGLAVAFDQHRQVTLYIRIHKTVSTTIAIQNSLSEMWTILNWTNPGSVGTKPQWDRYVAKPLMLGQSKTATDDQRTKAINVASILVDKLLPKHFLRRTKAIIKDQLPNKYDQVVFCPLTPKQIEVYKRILNMEPVKNLVQKDERCDCGSRKPRKKCCYPIEKGDLFKYLITLIKISNHLALILPSPSDTPEQTMRNRQLTQVAFSGETPPKYGTAMLMPKFCGKWMVLESLLKDWRKDRSNKVLIFTKSVKLLEMLEFHLREKSMALIDQFHEDPDIFVFLISTLAGGTGLNLTGANKVVIFDPNWNPAHDLQAIDRAYRFGQTRDVSVFRLLGAGSIEELIYARQVYKQQQMQVGYNASLQTRYFEGVQGEKRQQGELFGIKNIFTLHEGALATKQAVERAILSDFNWALANIDAKRKRPSGKDNVDAEVDSSKDEDNVNGLDSLLFDERLPQVAQKEDPVQRLLNDAGVKYTHRNDELMAESRIEGARFKKRKTETKPGKEKGSKARAQKVSLEIRTKSGVWPPLRRHHKPKLTSQQRLQARRDSLIELGHIPNTDEMPVFLEQFLRWPLERQQDFLAHLDAHSAARSQ
ncbi:hypothetical protein WOLCODRAFT_144325 [Wolfiporia cocos MD-104 SS10]|uniref:Nucleoside triphosphate hydrolase protein n=1 Tax=Wolfiporia cocos (strain MD-104) TaxID=742152 RepID=A0A2H3JLD4_WOLCO|nr:hypothetical protein WOLCODRAFT_144325 [Wolfiporia cocos MD-104 SS10]